ncbi:MAG: hypothetical protein AAF432_13605 [Planctomycetota bacterium]
MNVSSPGDMNETVAPAHPPTSIPDDWDSRDHGDVVTFRSRRLPILGMAMNVVILVLAAALILQLSQWTTLIIALTVLVAIVVLVASMFVLVQSLALLSCIRLTPDALLMVGSDTLVTVPWTSIDVISTTKHMRHTLIGIDLMPDHAGTIEVRKNIRLYAYTAVMCVAICMIALVTFKGKWFELLKAKSLDDMCATNRQLFGRDLVIGKNQCRRSQEEALKILRRYHRHFGDHDDRDNPPDNDADSPA